MNLEPVIGLEVHVQLATRSKLFCACPTGFGGTPNTRICPVCTGQPGALPVLNEAALWLAARTGLALGCAIGPWTRFDRKNYFYPDLPKGYQISQFDRPVAEHGRLEFERPDGSLGVAGITRAHLEEDAGKIQHPDGQDRSLVDLNRAGIPLVEIVGEPDLVSPQDAASYLAALRRTLRHAGVSDCDMEKGSMRCDANISVRPVGTRTLGTKVEIKNMNSIRNVERALEGEIARQVALHEAGHAAEVVQETRSFRDADGSTVSMRSKEEADDYRYFPDPDLPEFPLDPARVEEVRAQLPEHYRERRARYQADLGLRAEDAAVLTEDREVAEWFEGVVAAGADPRTTATWVQTELLGWLAASGEALTQVRVAPEGMAELLGMVDASQLSRAAAKKVLVTMLTKGGAAADVARDMDLLQIQDHGVLEGAVDAVLAAEAKTVADYRGGKESALNSLLGRVMRELKGKGDPQAIRTLLQERLGPPGS